MDVVFSFYYRNCRYNKIERFYGFIYYDWYIE